MRSPRKRQIALISPQLQQQQGNPTPQADNLEESPLSLPSRAKSGTYRAPPEKLGNLGRVAQPAIHQTKVGSGKRQESPCAVDFTPFLETD